jgi:hypothetical protein
MPFQVNFHCGEGADAVKKALELGTAAAKVARSGERTRAKKGEPETGTGTGTVTVTATDSV